MSSNSPRASISGASTSDEVAADFEESLKDLQINNRYEISNLTIIAKENTEHAQAISRALENHIKTVSAGVNEMVGRSHDPLDLISRFADCSKTAPSRKLPALFVLDSIVKNVGTPYTVYLGRNLFSIFMDAYTLVDGTTRRNMDAMLKTWKEPVPGSIDPRPVFPADTVRPIENALIKAKTAAINHGRQPQPGYRGTATPPQHNGQFATPPLSTPQPYGIHTPHQVRDPRFQPTATINAIKSTPQQATFQYMPPAPQPPHGTEGIRHDIESLMPRFQQKIASNPQDNGLRSQLGALQALHGLLGSRSFTQAELQQIKNQVSQLSAALPPQIQYQPPPQSLAPNPQWQPPFPVPFPQPHQPHPQAYPVSHPLPQLPSAAPPILTPDALNGLQALLANVPKPSTPQMRAAVPGFRDASHSQLHNIQSHGTAPASNGTADLLASLAKAGLINPASTSNPVPPNTHLPPASASLDPTASLLKSLQGVFPPTQGGGTPSQIPAQMFEAASNVPLPTASLKVFRPDLVYSLYDAQSNQCNTCGRRFLATEEGRAKKSRHLDWHFRTNQRVADPNLNRGHHRNWYGAEMDWIRHAEFDPSTTTATAADAEGATKPKKGPQDKFVRAPAGMTKNTCNICFEEMKSSYSEDLQDWIFMNATVHNGKIVHGTCLAEMTQGSGGGGGSLATAMAGIGAGQKERSATPDSLLGKRKAEVSMVGGGPRLRTG